MTSTYSLVASVNHFCNMYVSSHLSTPDNWLQFRSGGVGVGVGQLQNLGVGLAGLLVITMLNMPMSG